MTVKCPECGAETAVEPTEDMVFCLDCLRGGTLVQMAPENAKDAPEDV